MAADMANDLEEEFPPPQARQDFLGAGDIEQNLRLLLDENNLNNGWMLTGPDGIGKATLAYRIARAYLAPDELRDDKTLKFNGESQCFSLIAQNAHPDLIRCERPFDDKGKQKTQIPVETIRKVNAKMQLTAALSPRRVVIIDKANDLNISASNALLKLLEEPPAHVLLLLLCDAPGKILPTLRSRCRRLGLLPVEEETIAAFLRDGDWCEPDEAMGLAKASNGRPGYALRLAVGDGGRAIALIDDFLAGVKDRPLLHKVQNVLVRKENETLWRSFSNLLLQNLEQEIRKAGAFENDGRKFAHASMDDMLQTYENSRDLLGRGTALNADRGHMIALLGQYFQPLVRSHAG
jgi:DNA polymerase III subunit delta'